MGEFPAIHVLSPGDEKDIYSKKHQILFQKGIESLLEQSMSLQEKMLNGKVKEIFTMFENRMERIGKMKR